MINAFFRNTWFFISTSSGFMAPWTWENILYYPIAYYKFMKQSYLDIRESNR